MPTIRTMTLAALVGVSALLIAGCGSGDSSSRPETPKDPSATLATSLHGTGQGKRTWWSEANGGFQKYAHMEYDDLECKSCHQPNCENCHSTPGDTVPTDKCLGCHGRQKAEIAQGYSDVHRDRGMGCMDCHTEREMHGDGTLYASMLAPGAMDAKCGNDNCHKSVSTTGLSHSIHMAKVDCAACHMQGMVTCYNCHFESEVNEKVKRAYGQFKDWTFLLNRNGKVHPANFQSVSYQGNSFVAMAPFYAHTISRTGRTCDECHKSSALTEYLQTGKVTAVRWDAGTGKLVQTKGVIPVVPDYKTALGFDFVDYIGGQWGFLKSGADDIQIMFGEPLTQAQVSNMNR